METAAPTTLDLARSYVVAKRAIVQRGYVDDIALQVLAADAPVTESSFVREASWVVLSSGMRESVVRSVFPQVARALYDFDLPTLLRNSGSARSSALAVFRHEAKVEAILQIASTVAALGRERLVEALEDDPETFLRGLPYIGPVTWCHLAKNCGVPVAKADRHLARLAVATARESAGALCGEIASWLGEPVAVVDVVLWRWAVLHSRECGRGCQSPMHH